ncbi:MAG TPA: acyltransferase family protein [Terriglobales bacterium]|nr:acyltransferase family protein [Terriglobales bacterium]
MERRRCLTGGARRVGQQNFLTLWWVWALGAALAEIYAAGAGRSVVRRLAPNPAAIAAWGGASLALGLVDPTLFGLHVKEWILPFVCGILILALAVCDLNLGRALRAIGKMSYSLYLIHPVALLCVTKAGLFPSAPVAGIPFMVLCSLALAALLYWAVERHCIPVRKQPEPRLDRAMAASAS